MKDDPLEGVEYAPSEEEPSPEKQSQGPSHMFKQFQDKIKEQAERIQQLENYKQLCETRIQELDP